MGWPLPMCQSSPVMLPTHSAQAKQTTASWRSSTVTCKTHLLSTCFPPPQRTSSSFFDSVKEKLILLSFEPPPCVAVSSREHKRKDPLRNGELSCFCTTGVPGSLVSILSAAAATFQPGQSIPPGDSVSSKVQEVPLSTTPALQKVGHGAPGNDLPYSQQMPHAPI